MRRRRFGDIWITAAAVGERVDQPRHDRPAAADAVLLHQDRQPIALLVHEGELLAEAEERLLGDGGEPQSDAVERRAVRPSRSDDKTQMGRAHRLKGQLEARLARLRPTDARRSWRASRRRRMSRLTGRCSSPPLCRECRTSPQARRTRARRRSPFRRRGSSRSPPSPRGRAPARADERPDTPPPARGRENRRPRRSSTGSSAAVGSRRKAPLSPRSRRRARGIRAASSLAPDESERSESGWAGGRRAARTSVAMVERIGRIGPPTASSRLGGGEAAAIRSASLDASTLA